MKYQEQLIINGCIEAFLVQRKKKYSSSTPETTAENKLNRDFYATAPNQKRATDVMEFKIPGGKGKLYLSIILDLYDRYPVAYVISSRNDNKLVFRTFDRTIAAKPVFHSEWIPVYGQSVPGKAKEATDRAIHVQSWPLY